MIRSFRNQGTEDVFNGVDSKAARKICPANLVAIATKKLEWVAQAKVLEDLEALPNNSLERLKGDRIGQHAIRINDQYRICSIWTDRGAEQVAIVDYH